MFTKHGKFEGYKVNAEIYTSATEMVELLKNRPITDSSFHDYSKGLKDTPSWYGVENYEQALNLLRDGYQPVVNELKSKIQAGIANEIKRITFENNIVGYAPIVPLVLQGVPKNMISSKMKPIKTKVIDVYYDITCSYGTSSSQIIENGKNVLGAIMDLEAQGYKINLYSMQGYCDYNSTDMVIVKIKDSREPFDLKRMSFPLTHTAFFRIIGFDWYSRVPQGKYRSGYGCSIKSEKGEKTATDIIRKVVGNDKAVVLFGASLLYKSQEHIKEVLKNESNNK